MTDARCFKAFTCPVTGFVDRFPGQAAWQLEDAFQDISIDVYPDTPTAQEELACKYKRFWCQGLLLRNRFVVIGSFGIIHGRWCDSKDIPITANSSSWLLEAQSAGGALSVCLGPGEDLQKAACCLVGYS